MDDMPKIVVSRTLTDVEWQPTTIVDDIARLGILATEPGKDVLVLGSSTPVAGLAQGRLLDELRIMVSPVAIGAGRSVLASLSRRLLLRRRDVDRFDSGNMLLTYDLEAGRP
jgi:dihydrofolate reductase